MSERKLVLNVNGDKYELQARVTATLAEVLREKLGLTGTKVMCNEGECGACTVLINGRPVLSCMTLAIDTQDKVILTIEGLADPVTGDLHPIQKAFVDHSGMQCGVCTPGMILTAKALLDENPAPSEDVQAQPSRDWPRTCRRRCIDENCGPARTSAPRCKLGAARHRT